MQPIHLQYRTACFLLFALLHFSDAQQRDSTPVPQFMNVTDGPGLQAALKAGVKHIIVRRHLNLESLPVTDKEGAEFNAGVAPFTGTTMSLTVSPIARLLLRMHFDGQDSNLPKHIQLCCGFHTHITVFDAQKQIFFHGKGVKAAESQLEQALHLAGDF
jgi:hypothetical protein